MEGIGEKSENLNNLELLDLRYHAIKNVSADIAQLKKLKTLDLSHNIHLQTLPSSMGSMGLSALHVRGCTSMKTPPIEVINRGFMATLGYLKRLAMGSAQVTRTKLMLVGLGGAGKTRYGR